MPRCSARHLLLLTFCLLIVLTSQAQVLVAIALKLQKLTKASGGPELQQKLVRDADYLRRQLEAQ